MIRIEPQFDPNRGRSGGESDPMDVRHHRKRAGREQNHEPNASRRLTADIRFFVFETNRGLSTVIEHGNLVLRISHLGILGRVHRRRPAGRLCLFGEGRARRRRESFRRSPSRFSEDLTEAAIEDRQHLIKLL